MKWMLTAAVLVATSCGLPVSGSAKSKFYNATGNYIHAAWVAAGCAGIKNSCNNDFSTPFACKRTILAPGESGSYSFNVGTSGRAVVGIDCNLGERDASNTSNSGKQKRCAALVNDYDVFVTKCGYTEEEYEKLKNEPLPRDKKPSKRRR